MPQGEVDMNKSTDVHDAENITGHLLSIAVSTAQKSVYIKGTSKEEITRLVSSISQEKCTKCLRKIMLSEMK